jgi:hypothetical protein
VIGDPVTVTVELVHVRPADDLPAGSPVAIVSGEVVPHG